MEFGMFSKINNMRKYIVEYYLRMDLMGSHIPHAKELLHTLEIDVPAVKFPELEFLNATYTAFKTIQDTHRPGGPRIQRKSFVPSGESDTDVPVVIVKIAMKNFKNQLL